MLKDVFPSRSMMWMPAFDALGNPTFVDPMSMAWAAQAQRSASEGLLGAASLRKRWRKQARRGRFEAFQTPLEQFLEAKRRRIAMCDASAASSASTL